MMRDIVDAKLNRWRTPACAGALAFLALGQAAPGAIIDITASTNAYVRRNQGDQSESQTLQTKRTNDSNTRISYLRFAMPPGLNENDIISATLRLTFTATDSALGTANPDNVRVLGLIDNAVNGTITETNWTSGMIFADQPAGTTVSAAASVPNSGTALPTTNTTNQLGIAPIPTNAPSPVTPAVIDVPLTLADFQTFLAADTNDEVTLVFHTQTQNVLVSWASLTNTNGHLVPTLRLDVVPEPGSLATFALGAAGVFLSRRRRQTIA